MKSIGACMAAVFALSLPCSAAAQGQSGFSVVWDDFSAGFTVDTQDAKWLTFTAGTFVADDGIVTTSKRGLEVRSSGINPLTNAPAFVKTMGRDTGGLTPFDHVKWLVVMNHFASSGAPGFDAVPGQELACEATISGQLFGVERHPFGAAVANPNADPRLGTVATSAFDPITFMIFNFLVTNEAIYAFYEHPTFARDLFGDYAAFTYAVRVLSRRPSDRHDLKIAYDKARGTVRWVIDGSEVFRVDAIGARIDRRNMLLDRGGVDMIFSPDQLDCAMGTFDFLDGFGPTDRGLVQIDADATSYFNPRRGEPFGMTFLDTTSEPTNRLFGQGATMQVGHYVVSSRSVY